MLETKNVLLMRVVAFRKRLIDPDYERRLSHRRFRCNCIHARSNVGRREEQSYGIHLKTVHIQKTRKH